jgi:hypothetical protein
MKTSKEDIYRKDIIKVFEDVEFHEIAEQGVGYIIPFPSNNDIEVYLKKGYLKIHLTPALINLEIYMADSFTYIYRGRGEVISSSGYMVKCMKLRKESESCMSEFRNFLLLSICRDSFLSPEEEENAYIYMRRKDRWNMDYDFEYRDWYV